MRHERRGVTLIELVVALAVTSVVALVGAGTFEQLIDRRAHLVEASGATERESARRALVREWVQNGAIDLPLATAIVREADARRVAQQRDVQRTDTRFARTASDEFNVTTSANTPLGHRDVQVRLYIDDDPDTPEHGLSVEYRTFAGGPTRRQALDSVITTLTVEWLDARTRRWVPGRDARAITPAGVRLMFGASGDAARLRALPLTFALSNTAAQRAVTESEDAR
jgi:prepilin-type N-terminal cleavage/methylation domain-containing protein